jgi:hypothetical protein
MTPSYPVVRFHGQEFHLSFCHYEHAPHLCILLTGDRGDAAGLWASAVFAHKSHLATNEVLVLDHGPMSGMLRALEEAGAVRSTGRLGRWNGLSLPVAELTLEPPRHLVECAERVRDRLTEREQAHDRGSHER